ncbi:hypothetical protein EX30DRAFT_250270 [Ascodesmis nigricans]|uniref:Secreted protein n=1 Tax=Ascodesmis nigricans TaxID=341454 RepID=A0A4S2MXZ7_9PEZI|nr:hypothetical protein EX30DRAFT_250270 [Ascodesmis nigricans]
MISIIRSRVVFVVICFLLCWISESCNSSLSSERIKPTVIPRSILPPLALRLCRAGLGSPLGGALVFHRATTSPFTSPLVLKTADTLRNPNSAI